MRWPSDSVLTGASSSASICSTLSDALRSRAIELRVEPIDLREQIQAVADAQVIPELRALAEHDADLVGKPTPLRPRHEARDARGAARGEEQPRQHLERRRLAGAVRADERDALAGVDREVDAGDSRERLAPRAVESFGETFRFDNHGRITPRGERKAVVDCRENCQPFASRSADGFRCYAVGSAWVPVDS